MQVVLKLSDNLTVGARPYEEQLKQLAGQGIKSVVNLRTEGTIGTNLVHLASRQCSRQTPVMAREELEGV